jgi:plasmid maintenance system antidote protein VapI
MKLSEDDLRLKLKEMCDYRSQVKVGRTLEYSPQIICDVIHGRRSISKDLAMKMGYKLKKVTVKEYYPMGAK